MIHFFKCTFLFILYLYTIFSAAAICDFDHRLLAAEPLIIEERSVKGKIIKLDKEEGTLLFLQEERYVQFNILKELCLTYEQYTGMSVTIIYIKYDNGILEVKKIIPEQVMPRSE